MELEIVSLGTKALDAIKAGRDGRVLSVFHRTCYLESARGGIACVGEEWLPPGPLSVACRGPDGATRSSAFKRQQRWRSGRLGIVGPGWKIGFGSCRPWRPPPLPRRWFRSDLVRGLEYLAAIAGTGADWAERHEATVGQRSVSRAARCEHARAKQHLAGWLAEILGDRGERIAPSVPTAVSRLIGLGPGLTPSGDDLLGGALVALRILGEVRAADMLSGWVRGLARSRTHRISAAHLDAACDGEAAEALHLSLNALLMGDQTALQRALMKVDAIGHSSGRDALVGVEIACRGWLAAGSSRHSSDAQLDR